MNHGIGASNVDIVKRIFFFSSSFVPRAQLCMLAIVIPGRCQGFCKVDFHAPFFSAGILLLSDRENRDAYCSVRTHPTGIEPHFYS